ncbi:MAG: hypothetical protein HY391_02080 [Deltaproteobacteria bacterium]|nr:hypothetical protein [Deltaproteobacteria bacterium]
MGTPTPVILNVLATEPGIVIIEASDGNRYYSDLSSLRRVYCYPKSKAEWKKVAVDSYGLGLIWSSRFEVHVDQVISLATKIETIKKASNA